METKYKYVDLLILFFLSLKYRHFNHN